MIAIENVRLFNETKKALERQTATAEVLQVISSSVADARPVFEKILDSCKRLIPSDGGAVLVVDDQQQVEIGAVHGDRDGMFTRGYPRPIERTVLGLAFDSRRPLYYPEAITAEGVPDVARRFAQKSGFASILVAPMIWEGRRIGCISIARQAAFAYSEKDIDLLQSFADQGVIAIQNARLFRETNEALERQTATSEVLKVISESPTDVQPVLEAVAERAGKLCRADGSRVWLVADGKLRAMTSYGPAYAAMTGFEDLPLRRTSIGGRAVLERRCIHVEDVLPVIESEYPDIAEMQKRYGFRTVLNVPLLWEGKALGLVSLLRNEVRPFTPTEISLLQTFADQAVIAIQNARLFNETREALEQQTATGEVLKVISSSVADTAPVFEKILESGQRLFATEQMGVFLVGDDGQLHVASWRGEALSAIARTFPKPLEQTVTAQVLRERTGYPLSGRCGDGECPGIDA